MTILASRTNRAIALVLGICFSLSARAEVRYTLEVDDPGHGYAHYYDDIRRCLLAAGAEWSRHLGADATLHLKVVFHNEPTMSGTSVRSHRVGHASGLDVFEQGCAAKLLRHVNPHADGTDAQILIGAGSGPDDATGYLQAKLWFDPDPVRRSAKVPRNRIDAYSAFLHEFGHVLAFNGFLAPRTGAPKYPGQIATFDQFVKVARTLASDGSEQVEFFFTGPRARAVYGGDVPLNFDNYTHFGNRPPRSGQDLVRFDRPELMNGVNGYMGLRYHITALDVAVMNDCGIPCSLPSEVLPATAPTSAPAAP